jgi:predicted  nucleic acid-binding Zn ribbon protein
MYHVELTFRYSGKPKESNVTQGIDQLLGAWVNNGQILDADWPAVFRKTCCSAIVACPEPTSLRPRHANKWIGKFLSELRSYGVLKPKMTLLGRGLESSTVDRCRRPTSYFLMTNYLSIESPLRCGDDYLPVPLYRVPPTYEPDPSYWDILRWQKEWKSCDQLQMACGSAERWATKQISDPASSLSVTGRKICRLIEDQSGVPTYYYLYRGGGRSAAAERKRSCPSCGKKWSLSEPLHQIFDFKCNPCRLISNIAWSVRG